MIHYTVKRVRVHKYTRAEALAHMHTQHTKMFAERERERERERQTDRRADRQTHTEIEHVSNKTGIVVDRQTRLRTGR